MDFARPFPPTDPWAIYLPSEADPWVKFPLVYRSVHLFVPAASLPAPLYELYRMIRQRHPPLTPTLPRFPPPTSAQIRKWLASAASLNAAAGSNEKSAPRAVGLLRDDSVTPSAQQMLCGEREEVEASRPFSPLSSGTERQDVGCRTRTFVCVMFQPATHHYLSCLLILGNKCWATTR